MTAYHIGDRVQSRRESDFGAVGTVIQVVPSKRAATYTIATEAGRIIVRKDYELKEARA